METVTIGTHVFLSLRETGFACFMDALYDAAAT